MTDRKELVERLQQRTAEYVESHLVQPADHDALEAADAIENLAGELSNADGLVARLRAENEALKKDAARYRWLKKQSPFIAAAAAGWAASSAACKYVDPDEAIDVAMTEKP